MSSTSTTYSRHRKRARQRLDEEGRRSNSYMFIKSTDLNIKGSRELEMGKGKWSSDKLKQELSSFIAEFSYLTDTSNKTKTDDISFKNQSNDPGQQSFQVFAARRDGTSPFKDPELKRGVGWEDKNRETAVYNVQGGEFDAPTRRRGSRQAVVERPRLRVRKSRSARRSTSRDGSCPHQARSVRKVRRRFSGFRASKSRGRRVRARSCRSETPMRRRVRSRFRRRSRSPSRERSTIKEIPIRFRRRRTREVIIKKSKPKLVYKNIEPSTEPTLVTLFPRTAKRRPLRLRSREPRLACRCDMCTNKYESLARLYRGQRFNPCVPLCPPMCSPCPPTCAPVSPLCSPCPPKCQIAPREQSPCTPNWYCNTGNAEYYRPWANQCCRNDVCQPIASRCVKSVCFKFGATNQCLDSKITHYFHSILDRGICY